jgi:NAD(P)H-nitrite reductase large subunit
MGEEGLYACSIDSYKTEGVKLRSGQNAIHLDLNRRRVVLEHKEVVPFTGLIIAVGGRPRVPENLLVFRDHLLTLKTLEDARVWIDRLSQVDRVLMIGGDLTSFAVTRALLHLGKKVYFSLNEDAFWPLRWSKELFEDVAHRLELKGVEVITGRRLRSLARLSEQAYQVQIDERVFEVGLIGAFFGLVPDVRFLAGSGLRIDRGILVDEYLHTGFDGVYATGDCAQIYHPEIHDYWVSIGHDNAVSLGRTAALNLLGEGIRAGVPKESIFEVGGIKVNTSWWMEF